MPYAGPALANGEAYDVVRQDLGPRRRGVAARPTAHFDTGLTDAGWSGAQLDPPATTGNDSTDD